MDVTMVARARKRRKRTIRMIVLVIIVFFILIYINMTNEGTLGNNGGEASLGKIGVIKISDRQNGGAIIDKMAFSGVTAQENEDFNSRCIIAKGEILNVGTTDVDTAISLVGTTVSDERIKNTGLNVFPYYYKDGEDDPISSDPKAYFRRHAEDFDISKAGRGNGEITVHRLDNIFTPSLRIGSGEKYHIGIVMWLDEGAKPDASDFESSSVTLKIISRASES